MTYRIYYYSCMHGNTLNENEILKCQTLRDY
jgi:hypothetical protein